MSGKPELLIIDDGPDLAGEVIKQMSACRTKMPLITALMSYAGASNLSLKINENRQRSQSEELKMFYIKRAEDKRKRKALKVIKESK